MFWCLAQDLVTSRGTLFLLLVNLNDYFPTYELERQATFRV